jgi:hypothetical protein
MHTVDYEDSTGNTVSFGVSYKGILVSESGTSYTQEAWGDLEER